MTRKKTAYEKQTFRLLEEFDGAARQWGWTADQGHGSSVDGDRRTYEAAKAEIVKRLHQLLAERRKVPKLRAQVHELEVGP
jgi:hypothetical protein